MEDRTTASSLAPSVSSDSQWVVADLTMKVRRRFKFGFVSLSIQLETENGYFRYNGWHMTDVLPVVLSINSPVDGGTSIEAPSMEVLEKARKKKVRTHQGKEKKLGGIFVQISFLVLLKQELLKFDICTIQN